MVTSNKSYLAIWNSVFGLVQSLSRVRLFATPWTAARQASLCITNSQSLPKPMPIESVMPSRHLILSSPSPPAPNPSSIIHNLLDMWKMELRDSAASNSAYVMPWGMKTFWALPLNTAPGYRYSSWHHQFENAEYHSLQPEPLLSLLPLKVDFYKLVNSSSTLTRKDCAQILLLSAPNLGFKILAGTPDGET